MTQETAQNKLKALLDKTRSQEEVAAQKELLLFWGTLGDKSYLPQLKPCVASATTLLRLEEVTTLTMVKMYCKQKKVTKVITSSPSLLNKLLAWNKRAAPKISNYQGSYFKIPGMEDSDPEIEIVIVPPLKQLVTVPYLRFLITRFITKLTKPGSWYKPTNFTWGMLTPENEEGHYISFSQSNCFLIAVDVETFKENATIRCISYTGFWYDDGEDTGIHSESLVLPLDSEFNLAIMRKWNSLPAPKVFQNGKYDNAYLTRYNAPVYNYLYDTAHFFHSWYSELPKDLGFLNGFFIREAMYWKDLAETNDLHEYYRYNCLDTWGTGNAFISMLIESPQFAMDNYLLEFPLVFPCHLAEMTGIARDMDKLEIAKKEAQEVIEESTAALNTILNIPAGKSFNTNSTKQMKMLLRVLGCSDLPNTEEKSLEKAKFRHPFNARIINHVIAIRKARKLVSTYLTAGKEHSDIFNTGSRILYALNPHGTDSSRLASREHHFWNGINIQNIPRGPSVKRTFKADRGFLFAEVDLEQAESRDTAYISGDERLIQNVEHSPDFHCANASAFFGIPFEELFDVATGEKLNKAIRDLAKNVNHGANYNMGWYVLVNTMGEENILKARNLLGLPRLWSLQKIAEHLLEQFHNTYPDIKGVFYQGVIEEIMQTNKLESMAVHHSWEMTPVMDKEYIELWDNVYEKMLEEPRWTRYCFSNPTQSKSALNSYISHPPQSLNAQTLNKAWWSVFNDIAVNTQHSKNFKLCAQIHDSILFQYREGHEYLCDMVKERMEIPITIRAYDKKVRTFVVPAGIKNGKHLDKQCAHYWSETE